MARGPPPARRTTGAVLCLAVSLCGARDFGGDERVVGETGGGHAASQAVAPNRRAPQSRAAFSVPGKRHPRRRTATGKNGERCKVCYRARPHAGLRRGVSRLERRRRDDSARSRDGGRRASTAVAWHTDTVLPGGTDLVAIRAALPSATTCACGAHRQGQPGGRRHPGTCRSARLRARRLLGFQILTEVGLACPAR